MDSMYRDLNAAQFESEIDPFSIERYQQFYRHFPLDAKIILDVGCNIGRGGNALMLLNPGLEITGLDCVQERLDSIPAGIYQKTICSLVSDIDVSDSCFDVIVAGEFIEHLYPEDVNKALAEFYRVLKPNGILLLTTPNPGYLKLKLTGGSVLGGAHLSEHNPKDMHERLKCVGFKDVCIKGSGRVSRYLGENAPLLSLYGSYLVSAVK